MVGTCCFTPSLNLFKNKKLGEKTMNLPPAPKPQIELFRVEKQATIDGVEMGVLENGVPYLKAAIENYKNSSPPALK